MHSVQLTDRSATHVELVILDELKLVLACNESMPSPAGASIERVGSTRTKRNPELAAKLFSLVQREVERNTFDSVPAVRGDRLCVKAMSSDADNHTMLFQLVQRVHQLWLATIRLTHEIQLIRLRYPVAYTSPSPAVVRAQAIIMVCPIKAKLVASFDLTLDTLARWPTSTDAIAVAVEVKYSRADVKAECVWPLLSATARRLTTRVSLVVLLPVLLPSRRSLSTACRRMTSASEPSSTAALTPLGFTLSSRCLSFWPLTPHPLYTSVFAPSTLALVMSLFSDDVCLRSALGGMEERQVHDW